MSAKMRWIGLAVLLGALGAGALVAGAAEWPVETPEEIAETQKVARPGDQIIMRDGLWRDAEILFEAQGTPERPITLRARTPGKVVISGRSRLRIAGSHLVVAGLRFEGAYHRDDLIAFRRDSKRLATNCRLTDCAVIACNDPDGRATTRWVSLYGRNHRVDHCRIEGKTTVGATLVVWLADGQPAGHRIDHNHFGPRPVLGQNGGETIRVGDSKTSMTAAHVVVESNLFEECNGEAEIISNKSCANLYRNNTFLRCSGALTLRHGNDCTVEGNVFLGQQARGTGGVRIIGEGHRVVNNYLAGLEGGNARAALSLMNGLPDSPLSGYFPVRNAVVAFNTVVDCKETLVIGLADGDAGNSVPPEGCTIAGNLFIGRRGPLIDLRTRPVGFRWQDNLVAGPTADEGERPDGVRVAEIELTAGPDGLLRPDPAGPTVDAARGNTLSIRDDIDGQPRDAHPDVGCDEVSKAPVTRRPIRPEDVGPGWWAD